MHPQKCLLVSLGRQCDWAWVLPNATRRQGENRDALGRRDRPKCHVLPSYAVAPGASFYVASWLHAGLRLAS